MKRRVLPVSLILLACSLCSPALAQERGLGARPPTPAEQAYIDAVYTKVRSVAPNALARARATAEIEAARLDGTVSAAIESLPTGVDNSTLTYFPPIRSQGSQGSCTCWAAGYYYDTFTQAADEGYDVSGGDNDHICSPAFLYPLVNGGVDEGSNTMYAMARLNDIGCSSWTLKPYSVSDWISWPSEAAWVDALENRTLEPHYIDVHTAEGLQALKQHLANGDIAVTSFATYDTFYYDYPSDATGIGNEVYYCPDGSARGRHACTIVGYDDSKSYVDHRDGQTHYGAFLMANSWGALWGATNTAGGTWGFFWVAYEMFFEGDFGPDAYFNTDRDDYRPSLYAVMGVNHEERGRIALSGGVEGTAAWESEMVLSYDGGNDIAVTDAARVAVDLSDGVAVTAAGEPALVKAYVGVSPAAVADGTITSAEFFEDLDGDGSYRVSDSSDPVVEVAPGRTEYAHAWVQLDGFRVLAVEPDPAVVHSAGTTQMQARHFDSQGYGVATWLWDDGGAGGSFEPSAEARSPRYTAAPNYSDYDSTILLTATGTNDGPGPLTDSDTTPLTVRAGGPPGVTARMSAAEDGTGGNAHSDDGRFSADGRFVAFASGADNLVPGDANDNKDIFLRDREAGTLALVSIGPTGEQPELDSSVSSVSADGRYVVFGSLSRLLIPGDTNEGGDILLYDRITGELTWPIWAWDGSRPNGSCWGGVLSWDNRYLAFVSSASNLIEGDTSGSTAIYRLDRSTGEIIRVSDGREPSISADGRYVAWSASQIYVTDCLTGETELVSIGLDGTVAEAGSETPAISADGRYVAFCSGWGNFVPGIERTHWIVVHDRLTRTSRLASATWNGAVPDGKSQEPCLSADGRYVGFRSNAANLLPSETSHCYEVFLHDRWGDRAIQIDRGFDDPEWGFSSGGAFVSANGRYVLFGSTGGRLVLDDTNGMWDVFVHDRFAPGSGSIAGSVTDAASGDAIAGATVAISGRMATSGWDGAFLLPVVPTGAAQVVAVEAPGYETWRLTDVSVGDGQNIELDIRLGPEGCGYVVGRVTNAALSLGLWGTTVQLGTASATCGPGGYYTLVIPAETEGTVAVSKVGYYPAARTGVSVGAGASVRVDFPLSPEFADTSASHWAAAEVGACVSAGIVAGYDDACYHPEWPVARDQIAVFISRSICTPTGEAGMVDYVPPVTPSFTDVPADYWAYKYIECAAEHNIIGGYGDNLYHPEYSVDRGQMAVFVARSIADPTGDGGLAGYTPPATPTFPDVPTDFWSYRCIEYIADPEQAIVGGYWDGLYHHEILVSRDQMAVYIAKAFGLGG